LNYTRAAMPHGWHKSAAEMYLPVLQEKEVAQVTSMGLPLLQCHPGPTQAQHRPEYDGRRTHHQWHHGVSHPDN